MYKIINNQTPNYLNEIVEPYIHSNNESRYPIRNNRLFDPPLCRTVTYSESFFPSMINEFNRIAPDLINIQSTNQLKNKLKKHHLRSVYSITNNIFKLSGSRQINIILCQLRNNASNLNYDKYNDHLIDSPLCGCGQSNETALHYFFYCNLYLDIRPTLLHNIHNNDHNHHTLKVLLHGCSLCNDDINNNLIAHITDFIIQSKRFNTFLR